MAHNSDDDNDLFGADSDSDDTADLIQTSTTKKAAAAADRSSTKKPPPGGKKTAASSNSSQKKPAAAAKPKKSPGGGGSGGLFDSDSDDDDDDEADGLGNMDAKKKRLAALAQKRKKKETPTKASASSKSGGGKRGGGSSNKEGGGGKSSALLSNKKDSGGGYDSAASVDSHDLPERTADDDNFIDTTGEDPEDVSELYAQQNFDDDERPDNKKKMKKRRAPQSGQGNADDDANNPIMSVVNRMKKKKTEKKSLEVIEQEVHVFLHQMHVAAERDQVAIADRKPALHKLNMLADVCTMLTKKDMQHTLLEKGLLKECKMWISPLPNGTLGNITIRTRLLESIAKMPVSKDNLKQSGFGQVVMHLYKHPTETPALKRQLKKLIEDWSRPIFKKSDKMTELDRYDRPTVAAHATAAAANGGTPNTAKKQDLDSLITSGKSKESTLTASQQRVQVPYSRGFSYQVRPADRSSSPVKPAVGQASGGEIRDKLKKRMVEKGRKVSKNQRSANLSVEGRATK